MRNSNTGESPNRRNQCNVYNSLNSHLRNWGDEEDVDITPQQKDGSPGKYSRGCVTHGNEMSPCGVLGSLRKNTSNGNEEIEQKQNVRFLQVDESVRYLPDNAFNFDCTPTTSMTVSTTTPMYGYSHGNFHNLESDISPMFDDLLVDDIHAGERRYFRLGSATADTPGARFEVAARSGGPVPNADTAQGGQGAHNGHSAHNPREKTGCNLSSRKKTKGRRTLFTSFCRTVSLLCNEVLSKSFQTMISYVITTSFFICLNLYVSNSCTYEEIGGFGVAVSVITLLNAVVDGVGNSLDYFCGCSIGMAKTDLSLLYLNIAYHTFYSFFAKVVIVFFLAKILFLLFLNYLYAGVIGNVIGSVIGKVFGKVFGKVDGNVVGNVLGSVDDPSKHAEHVQMIHVFCSSLQILLVSFFPQFVYECTRRYLILHNYIYPSLFSSFVSFILLNFFSYLFVFALDMKYVGACLSLLLTNLFNFFCVLYFLRIHLARCVSSEGNSHQLGTNAEEVLLCGDHYVEVGETEDSLKGENSEEEIVDTTGDEFEDDLLDRAHRGLSRESGEDPLEFLHGGDRRIYNLAFLFFHKPADDERKRAFIRITRTNIKNIFFEILSFEFQLFEATYLSLSSVATFVQINNILNLVYYVSNSYGIVLSKLISIYASSGVGKWKSRQKRTDGRHYQFGMEPLCSGGTEWVQQETQSKEDEHRKGASPSMALHNPQEHIMCELKPRRNRRRIVITLVDIVLAFSLMLTFLSLCLFAVYFYRDQIIPFVFSNVNIQKELEGIILVLVVELFLEILASLLNSIIKGLSLQEEISSFTFFNFLFFMHPLGLLLTFILHFDIYGFVYSNLVSMAVQVAYLVVFLALRARGGRVPFGKSQ
ncbi:multidrug efflux pump, putative [Plasmodium knowlesi strain H]|uniref:Multidrug efflux pump, putative n=1 Tax=Plasmodium knowlesi (strain H) TaxID=5851 RepID=A0A679KW49_PLAKH|nr:multidrug efflux pump, putative [Plasmodium knowlesi strain H]CAA9986724.1 multidrug efflux pump, putative [Plasmodium knowlesi strain H]VVS76198.1 multidrug efflux pump, putative [Plasmodium knowlesi strain H]